MSQAPNDFVQRAQAQFANAVREHSTMFLVEGIVLVVLGILAILLPNIASLAVEILIGWLMLIGGAVGLYMTFTTKGAPGYWWSLISAVISIIAGILLLIWPITGIVSLTIVLVAFFLIEGISSIMYAIEHRGELDAGERHRHPGAGVPNLRRPTLDRGLGDRPPGRHRHGVRRNGHDRHCARRPQSTAHDHHRVGPDSGAEGLKNDTGRQKG